MGALLTDPDRVRFRAVLTPERMAIAETERLLARLRAADVPLAALVVNRLFTNPAGCDCDRCRRDERRHAERLETVESTFELPIRRAPELDGEARGLDRV